jgi:hypothetical protein
MYDNASSTIFSAEDRWERFLAESFGNPHELRPTGGPDTSAIERDWETWLRTLFPYIVRSGFGEHHEAFWQWVWSLDRNARPHPFVAIWPRGGAKSSSAELACVAVGARRVRRYGLYISETQDLADKHVMSIAGLLESDAIARYYPALGNRDVSKYGSSKGWRRNRLRTAAGFTIDSVGLDTGVRGIKVEDVRPDFMVIDDVDSVSDTIAATEKKITTLTQSLLPAGSIDNAVLAVQNLIHPNSIFSRLAGTSDHEADFLADRTVSGPFPAIYDMQTKREGNRTVITDGTPLWGGQDLAVCQDAIDTYGLKAFLSESQQEVDDVSGGMFEHIDFESIRVEPEDVPDLVKIVAWCDPAVTDKDTSDAHGVQIDGIDANGIVYRLFSWEQRASPEKALLMAITKAIEYGALKVGVETNQGGDLWKQTFNTLIEELNGAGVELDGRLYVVPQGKRAPVFDSARAGGSHDSKAERASRMLLAYEQDRIRHVRGTHLVLEKALKRFLLVKPFDLVDAAYWSWNDLAGKPARKRAVAPIVMPGANRWGSS